jgi:hypothetical protein
VLGRKSLRWSNIFIYSRSRMACVHTYQNKPADELSSAVSDFALVMQSWLGFRHHFMSGFWRSGLLRPFHFPWCLVSMSVRSNHEKFDLFVTNTGQHSLTLGTSGLKKHNPGIDCTSRAIFPSFCLNVPGGFLKWLPDKLHDEVVIRPFFTTSGWRHTNTFSLPIRAHKYRVHAKRWSSRRTHKFTWHG